MRAWDFLRLIFGPGIFFSGGGGVVGSPRVFFWRGVDFVPIRSSPSLEIFISWKTFFLSLLCSDQFSSNCKLKLFTKPGSFPENK